MWCKVKLFFYNLQRRKQPRKKLTLKQERFVQEYVKDGNATKAVRIAYPNIKTEGARRVMGHHLVTNNNVQQWLQEVLDKEGLTIELIVGELKGLISGEDTSEKNRAIRTALEILGLIGKGGIIATQVNIMDKPNVGYEDLKKKTTVELHQFIMGELRKGRES